MILSTKGRYAVMAMVELATKPQGKPVSLSDIAQMQEIPLAYLEQIFARLKRAKLVKSVRGPGGGYQLGHAMEAITVADIILAADETIKITRCGNHSAGGCVKPSVRCMTHDLWEGLERHIFNYLQSISLADVCSRKLGKKEFVLPDSELAQFMRMGA